MTDTNEVRALLRHHLADPRSGWSIGSLGALAEFQRTESEPARVNVDALSISTDRGALRISPQPATYPLAYEMPLSHGDRWQHGVVFCLPQDAARRAVRRAFTDIGPDSEPVSERGRDARLFDLGLGAPNVDACIRTPDADLVAALEPYLGRPLLEPPDTAMEAIKASSPDRVFVSALGRIEIYQPIPAVDASSPEGPHTHVLPELLASGRTHPPEIPVPVRRVPCLHLHPPGPFRRSKGRVCLDAGTYQSFQKLLERWGDPHYRHAKTRVMRAVRAGRAPHHRDRPQTRTELLGLRIALRQLRHVDGDSESLACWRDAFED
ncbi:MAG: hypothetical protein GWN84_09485 [Gammaproteobacteria bacterium]|nr:hypothetical protein [Gammaproteobacteria bacterium]NIR83105.1 hypothetical protein [Gammaproteobacteria bacterium]NIR90767.1 hypothetical protein [Gammaproteobacteria bacterium]NIU04258.1 hypothetical protein [Gammaproteobacteria bacterium]NIV51550.1 hypothetical protein [Gammaproteobacteria bacterium]